MLNDLSVLEHNDLVGVHERRSAVRDKEDRGAAELFSESRAYLCVGLGVNGGKRVVKHHDGRLFGQHTRNCGALLLTARKGDSPLAHKCVITLGKALNGIVEARDPCRLADILHADIRPCHRNIIRYRAREEIRLLKHDAYIAPQVCRADIGDIDAAYRYPAAAAVCRQLVKAVEQMHER